MRAFGVWKGRASSPEQLFGLAARSTTSPIEQAEPDLQVHGPQVLLVDDDPIILMTTSLKLKAAGYQVLTATDCSEALSLAGENNPRFILLDVHFPPDISNPGAPAWNGFQLMYWLRDLATTRDARYILMSSTNWAENEARARDAGAIAFFPKPLDHNKLLSAMREQTNGPAPKPQATPRRWWAAMFDFL